MAGPVLRVAETHPACTVLGPGRRFGVWVQGCPLRCPGCISEQWLPFEGGVDIPVAELARTIMAVDGIDGITVSGGEPFAQAEAVTELLRLVRAGRAEFDTLVYTGYTIERLQRRGTDWQRALLAATDILVDGPYVESQHDDLLWRSSRNQRIHFPTGLYSWSDLGPDVSAGLQIELTGDGDLTWLGVPPVPRFLARYEQEIAAHGIFIKRRKR